MYLGSNLLVSPRGGIGRHARLDCKVECLTGNGKSRTAQIRGNLLNGDPEPSHISHVEGVETRRAAPKANCYGEGIVQTTNAEAAVKTVVGMKILFT